jgi:serine/threonine-protein kinase PknG
VPVVDGADPAAGYLATLSALDPERQAAELAGVASGAPGTPAGIADSVEVHLALARARIDAGDLDGAEDVLTQLIDTGRADWRVTWYQGLRSLAAGEPAEAQARFDAVYDALPGELAPKLAIALAAEAAAAARTGNGAGSGVPDLATAARLFRVVWTVDRSYVSAALGLARVRLATGDRAGAVDVLAAVPETSSHYIAAQIAAVRAQISGQDPARLAPADLHSAGSRLQRLRLDTQRQQSLAIEILGVALDWVTGGAAAGPAAGQLLLDCELNERALRFGLEKSYRALARLAPADDRRIELVDLANDVRPRTRF